MIVLAYRGPAVECNVRSIDDPAAHGHYAIFHVYRLIQHKAATGGRVRTTI